MKTDYLLPHIFRKIGWFIFIPCFVMIMVSWLGINDWFNDDRLSFITLHIGNLSFFGSVLKPSCKSILLSAQFHKYLLPLHYEESPIITLHLSRCTCRLL